MSDPGQATPLSPGDVVAGKYEVERVLGRGGMGIVVAARHRELDTKVAIKVLLPETLKDEEAVARFQREARAAVSLKSEHSVRVMDVGKTADGSPFMVMEMLVGRDLGAVVESGGPLPVADAVDYVLQACEAVAEAHARGIVHRDLKPQNLFLTQRVDGRPLVKVLDFGLAKSIGASSLDARALTRSATMMGSPMYMSPEQMRASPHVDARSDIWALGVCLYELLTAEMPFTAETAPELCAAVLKTEPKDPRAVRPELPEGLASVVLRCLDKDPAARFRDVGALALQLEPFGAPTRAVAAAAIRAVLDRTLPARRESGSPTPPAEKTTRLLDAGGANTQATFITGPPSSSMWSFAAIVASALVGLSFLSFVVFGWVGGFSRSRSHASTAPAAFEEAADAPSPNPPPPEVSSSSAASAPFVVPVEPSAVSGAARRPVRSAEPPIPPRRALPRATDGGPPDWAKARTF